MKKNSTAKKNVEKVSKGKKTQIQQAARNQRLTVGVDLGDRSSRYCILDEAGEVVSESQFLTTKAGLSSLLAKMPSSRVALEVGTHSPWVSRRLSDLGHEVIVAHARNVRLIGESRRKDDRLDAQTLARLARKVQRQDSEFPVQHWTRKSSS